MSAATAAEVVWYRPTALPIDPATVADIGYSRMRVTSTYGERSDPLRPSAPAVFHDGNDIGNARGGDTLIAAAAGKVIAAGDLRMPWSLPRPSDAAWESWGGAYAKRPSLWRGSGWAGFGVVIQHAPDCITVSAHMDRVDVADGQVLAIAEPIGVVGDTGSAVFADHVHFGVIRVTLATILALGRVDGRQMTRDPWPLIAPHSGPDASVPGKEDPVYEWHGRVTAQLPKRMVIPQGTETFLHPADPSPATAGRSAARALVGDLNEGPRFWVYLGYPGTLRLVRKRDIPADSISAVLVVPSPTPAPQPAPDLAAQRIDAAAPHLNVAAQEMAAGITALQGEGGTT